MFKVMTWNVENLFLPGTKYGPKTQAAYDAKLAGLASVIKDQTPDALALQEIGHPTVVDDLIAAIGGNWNKQVSDRPDPRGIRVAWLSLRQMVVPRRIVDFPSTLAPVQQDDVGGTTARMGRGALGVTVTADSGEQVQLVATHLKSKLLTFPGDRFAPTDENERARFAAYALYRRAAEAATLRSWATTALADQGETLALVVAGDLNDAPQAATTQLLLGPPGSEIDTRGFKMPDAGDHQRLWNLAPLMPAGRNYSRLNQGVPELIDHILVSDRLVRVVDVNSVGAVIVQPLPSISGDPTERLNAPSSDHAPVAASFTI